MTSTATRSALVVGAGIVGAATAYFLSRAGFAVRVLEAQVPAAAASGAADGAVSVASKRAGAMMNAALRGLAFYRQLEKEGLFAGLFHARPTIMFARGEMEAGVLDGHAATLADAGVSVERLAPAQFHRRVPVATGEVTLAVEVGDEGHAIGYALVHRLLSAAGVQVMRHSPVRSLLVRADGTTVHGVETEQGAFEADIVVLAAGSGTAALLGLGDFLRPVKGQLLVTERAPGLAGALPGSLMSCGYLLSKSVTAIAQPAAQRRFGLVVDPLRTGQFLIGGTRERAADCSNDYDAIRHLLGQAALLIPALRDGRLLRAFAGVRTTTADGYPMVGYAPGLHNAIVATGFEGDGICLGPLVGRLVQQLASGRRTEIDISAFDPARFIEKRAAS
jgi:glycine/D-amino acid oxidase-like deaminating enzyme